MNTQSYKRNIVLTIVVAIVSGAIALALFGQPLLAKATMLAFKTDCKTATATSTLNYMTPGTATTTLTCVLGGDGADSARLLVQVNASSTNTRYNLYVEESTDGLDWYPLPVAEGATTTNPYSLAMRAYATFDFASSTIGGTAGLFGASTTYEGFTSINNRNHYELAIPVTMQRVRVYATLASTTGSAATNHNGAIWMQILPRVSY